MKGDVVIAQCFGTCGKAFTYINQGSDKPRKFCPECKKARIKIASKKGSLQFHSSIRNFEGENSTHRTHRTKASAVVMSHGEAAKRLALWEGMERLQLTGDTGVMKAMSRQAVRQLEKKALKKIRRAIGPEYEAFKAERSARTAG